MKIAKYNIPKNINSTERIPGTASLLYGSNANSGITSAASANQLSDTHLIFGQPFNGTQDVAGDIINAQNITNEGDINVKSYTDDSGVHGGNIYADRDITATNYYGENAEFTQSLYGENIASPHAYLHDIEGNTLTYNYAEIKELLSQDITTNNLTVTGTAHFFELIIDKIKAAGGAVILSPADGFKIDVVRKVNSSPLIYQVLWKANDGERAISNMWKAGDQAICQSFNQAGIGTSYNVTNKYYWVKVSSTGTQKYNGEDYHYIEFFGNYIAGSYYVGVVNPEVGDEIAMLGSRALKDDGTPDLERQSAIYISAYSSIDSGLKAPFIAQYTGINDFNLASHRYTWFAHNGNEIRGNFKVSNGQTIENYIDDSVSEITDRVSELEITADGLTSSVQAMKGYEYDLYDVTNWTFDNLIVSKQENTPFDECFSVPTSGGVIQIQINKSMSFKHLIPISSTSTILVNSGWSATVLFFGSNKKYLGTSQKYTAGEHAIQATSATQYVGLIINVENSNTSSGGTVQIISIPSYQYGIRSSGIKISDSKIASSLIQQTADEILMKVDEVSLKIDNKKITLDGNTEINGNLNIKNSDTGFTLQGAGGNTQISPKTIGTFSEFSVTSNITDTISKHIATSMPNPDAQVFNPEGSTDRSTTRNYILNYEFTVSLGTLKSGDYVEFKNQILSYSATDGNFMASGIKKYEIYRGTTLVKTLQTYENSNTSVGNYTATFNGDYSLKITINFNCTREAPAAQTDPTKPSTDYYYWSMPFTADYSLQIVKPTGDAHMLIGYDGIAANFGNNKTVYIGKNETTIKYGNYGLSITSSGIKKYNGSTWVTANI